MERRVVVSSPFLFTTYVRPLTLSVEQHLSQHGATLFAAIWSQHSPPPPPSPPARRRGVCELPAEWGSGCGGRIPQWTFNRRSGECESYWYSGCGATKNLFSNERKCRLQCSPNTSGSTVGHSSCFEIISSLERLIVRVPSDDALQKFLSSVESNIPADTILQDETFARKLLLGSMQVMGREKSLRPDWEMNLKLDHSVSGEMLDQYNILISDLVLALTQEDLSQAIRGLSARELGRGICWFCVYL